MRTLRSALDGCGRKERVVRVAVAGASGNIGRRTVRVLEQDGHEVVPISRASGVDLADGAGLDEALNGVEAVVDAVNGGAPTVAETVTWFGAATHHLLEAEARCGVGHHVLLSIAGLHRVEGNAHYAGKREQERLVAQGPVPWTILPATQFHDFAEMVARRAAKDGVAPVAPLLLQPVAPDDVAGVLAELAVGDPQGRYADLAGPGPQDLVDMARRTLAARGEELTLVPTWDGPFGVEMAGNVLLAGPDARIAPTSFDAWLAEQH
jgi:uncharacterized protein YbjT (DUF2867 family)